MTNLPSPRCSSPPDLLRLHDTGFLYNYNRLCTQRQAGVINPREPAWSSRDAPPTAQPSPPFTDGPAGKGGPSCGCLQCSFTARSVPPLGLWTPVSICPHPDLASRPVRIVHVLPGPAQTALFLPWGFPSIPIVLPNVPSAIYWCFLSEHSQWVNQASPFASLCLVCQDIKCGW